MYKLLVPLIIVMSVVVTVVLLQDRKIVSLRDDVTDIDNNDEKISTGESGVEIMTGRLVVHIPVKIQKQSNLQLTRLTRSEYRREIHAIAKVIDIQSLLELKSRYLEAQTEKVIAETALQVSSQEYDRLKLLRSEASNISERQLQQSKLEWMSNQSKLQAARVKTDNIRNQVSQGWGQALSEHVFGESNVATDLFKRKSVLILVTLEGKQLLPANTESILVNIQGSREDTRVAYYISPASFTDNTIYGQSYFFHTDATHLPAGVFMDAWIPSAAGKSEGVLIPSEAIIWYVDKPWVYIKIGTDAFARKELNEYTITRDGWFVQNDFEPDEEIVLLGGQMLLSEEFRWSIPDEDDDP